MDLDPTFVDNFLLLALFFGAVCLVLCAVAIGVESWLRYIRRQQSRQTWYVGTVKQTINEIKIHPKGYIK